MDGKPLAVRLPTAKTCSSIFFPHVGCGSSVNIHALLNYFYFLLVTVFIHATNGELTVSLNVNSWSLDYTSKTSEECSFFLGAVKVQKTRLSIIPQRSYHLCQWCHIQEKEKGLFLSSFKEF